MRARAVVLSLVATLAAALLVAVGAPTATAATGTITATPSTDLSTGQVITVSGTGFSPSTTIVICEGIFAGTLGAEDCGGGPIFLASDPDGSFSVPFTVRRFLIVGGNEVDCAAAGAACGIGAAEWNNLQDTLVATPISLAPATGHPRPDLVLKRRDTQQLVEDGEYFTAVSLAPQHRHPLAADGHWTFALVVQNDGDVTDDLVLSAPYVPTNPFSARFFFGYYDVTAAVTGSGLVFHDVAPGQSFTLGLNVSGVGAFDTAALVGVRVRSGTATELVDWIRLWVTAPNS